MARVSIIMGVYNAANRVEKAIISILNQTFTDFEFIICDDGSTDDTYAVLNRLQTRDNRIVLLKNPRNMQLAYTLNRCIEIASGEYIARMDDDDYAYPDRISKQVEFLDKHQEYALVGTGINYYDADGIWGTCIFDGEVSALDVLKGRSFVHPSVVIRSNVIKAVNGYSTSKSVMRNEDLDLWVRLYVNNYKGYNMGEILLNYYEDSRSYKKRKYKYRICEYKIRLKARKLLGLSIVYYPYVIKPLLVGLLPKKFMIYLRKNKYKVLR